jgi:hypothetical protein
MPFHSLIHSFWMVEIGLQALLAAVLLYRGKWRKFPLFTAYTLFNLLEAALAFCVSTNGMLYFYTYWICEAITTILALAVVYEIFTSVFSAHGALRRLSNTVLGSAVVVLVVLGIFVMFTQQQAESASIGSPILVVAESARFIEVGLLMFLLLFSTVFGLHWKTHVFGIALGLGVFAAVDLVNMTLRSYFGHGAADILNLARVAAFCLSILLWTLYLSAPERDAMKAEMPKHAQLEQWNQAVMELINR